MKKLLVALSLLAISSSSFAFGNFNSDTGTLVIRDLSVDGTTPYDNVKLQLNMKDGTFTILETNINTIKLNVGDLFSSTPLDSLITESLKVDFMGCHVSITYDQFTYKKHQVICNTQVISLNGDKEIFVLGYIPHELVDNQSTKYRASTVIALDYVSNGPEGIIFNAIKGIPVAVKFIFNDIDSAATSISAFKPVFYISQEFIEPDFPVTLELPRS